ncbi:ABC-type multidrug transport system, ATPase component [Sediminibacterium ginsengisoli]|uniref:ABC-type multidrug transport system, ATPase component n=2 Tax=Sediminibacterium ginsengisoli TaxID=413434 RepID=A0A1T4JZM9_9BACT|nr:ABC-type multidrug transport system, ATPase component [Sediminibacterium ginsengisoli]
MGNMKIVLTDAGKRFNRDWIFRRATCAFEQGKSYAITGPNGSGKSTLLQVIAGSMNPSEGKVDYSRDGNIISSEQVFRELAIAAPYLEIIEEMTAREFLTFHSSFKPFINGLSVDQALDIVNLSGAADKQIRYYSSGMKQRVKLAQAIFPDLPIVLLDEPCTNLDVSGYELYYDLLHTYCKDKLVIVCSNDPQEYRFCSEVLSISDYK